MMPCRYSKECGSTNPRGWLCGWHFYVMTRNICRSSIWDIAPQMLSIFPYFWKIWGSFPEDGGSRFLQNVTNPSIHMASYPKRLESSPVLLWESQITGVQLFLPHLHAHTTWYCGKETVFMLYFDITGVCLTFLSQHMASGCRNSWGRQSVFVKHWELLHLAVGQANTLRHRSDLMSDGFVCCLKNKVIS